jgi:fibronectin-binding autotransporter adhesin
MATLSTTVYGYTLAAGGYLTITNTGVIKPPGLVAKSAATVVSSGSITGTSGANVDQTGGQGGIGAVLADATSFTNNSGARISGGSGGYGMAARVNGTIVGGNGGAGGGGVHLSNGSLTNSGAVVGGSGGTAGNEGQIAYAVAAGVGGAGIVLVNSSLSNGGTIRGGDGGNVSGPVGGGGSYDNGGTGGRGGTGVALSGGYAFNSGTVSGGNGGAVVKAIATLGTPGDGGAGVSMEGGIFANAGTIHGGTGANRVGYGGSDHPSGRAANGGAGVLLASGTLENTGAILGGYPGNAYIGQPGKRGAGVSSSGASSIYNGSTKNGSASITGSVGVEDRVNGGVTLNNFGTISGTGESVLFRNSSDLLIAEAGSVFNGKITGGGGTLELAAGAGTLTALGGSASVIGAVTAAFGGFGAYVIDAGGQWAASGGKLATQQSLTVANGSTLTVTSGTLSDGGAVTNAGLVEAKGSGVLLIANTTFTNGASGQVEVQSIVKLNAGAIAGGDVTVAAGGKLYSQGVSQITGATVTDAGDIYGGKGGVLTIDGDVTNTGRMSALGGGDVTINGGVTSGGLLLAFGGNLTITGTVSGTGTVAVCGAGILDIGGALTENASFAAKSTGELILGDSQAFSGTVKGLSTTGTNSLDLRDIAFAAGTTTAIFAPTVGSPTTGGVLTVTDGTHTAQIGIVGNYTGTTFTVASDSLGGTIVTDHKSAVANASHLALTSAMAGFAPTTVAATSYGGQSGGHLQPLLAVPV